MKLPSLKHLNKTTWFVVIASIVIVSVWIAVIFPAVRRLQATAQALLDTQTTEASSTQATANLISALQRQTELEDAAQRLDSFYISRTNPVVFVSRLEELANDHRVTLEVSLQEPAGASAGPIAQGTVSVTAGGLANDVFNFYNALLTEPVFLDVQTLEINTPSDTANVISLHLQAISYWQ